MESMPKDGPVQEGRDFATELIRDYYAKSSGIGPGKIESREFGVGTFDTKILSRHLSFKTKEELKGYLVANAPPYISYSTAYYRNPAFRPMENKGWTGSELVFDLDVDDMDIECQKKHGKSWVCENCLESVKSETIKLIEEFLMRDFGFSKNEIAVNFSGNRGYHVHIKRESLQSLSRKAREEISDYIAGNGITFEDFFRFEDFLHTSGRRGKKLAGPRPEDAGWSGRIARSFLSKLKAGPEALASAGMTPAQARSLFKKRALLEMGVRNGNWDIVEIKNKTAFWSALLEKMAVAQSDRIDKNVTKDPTHLIRMPDTIHGGTGLVARNVGSLTDLESFDPMSQAIAFNGREIEVTANADYEIVMGGRTFGPFKDEKVRLPVYAGMYLYLKGLAYINST